MEKRLVDLLRIVRSGNVGPVGARYILEKGGEDPINYLHDIQLKWRGKNISIFSEDDMQKEIQKMQSSEAYYIPYYSNQYPAPLYSCYDAPCVLICDGNAELLNANIISITGMRNASSNGVLFTKRLCSDLVSYGFVICAGGAVGIDTAAHLGSMPNTIAVLPGGLDQIYPYCNKNLINSISQSGLVITEHPFGTTPRKSSFCQRNRIIAGISNITCVMESGINSGSLSTAYLALKYHRDLLAVPGHPTDPHYKGNNELLLNNSAQMLLNVESVLKTHKQNRIFREERGLFSAVENSTLAQKIYDGLSFTPISVEDLCELFDQPISAIMSAVGELDCIGAIVYENMQVSRKGKLNDFPI